MPDFAYHAKDSTGRTIDGSVEAEDTKGAAAKIREMGYWPTDIHPLAAPVVKRDQAVKGSANPFWTGASVREKAVFFRQLGTMLASGMYLSEALDSLGQQKGVGARLAHIARLGAARVREGGMLSEVLAAYPTVFSRVQIGLVETGERGGMLDRMVSKVADYTERDFKLKQRFSRLTFYPKLIFVFCLIVWTFVPRVNEIVNGGFPKVLEIAQERLLPVVLLFIMVWAGFRILMMVRTVRFGWDATKLGIPVISGLVRKLAMSRFSSTLSVLYSAGLPLGEGVDLAADSLGNEFLARRLRWCVPRLRAGGQLSEALQQAGGVPEMVVGMLTTGERTGGIDVVLDKVSEYYDEETTTSIEKLGWMLFVLLIVVAAVVVFMIVIQLLGMYLNPIQKAIG